jgi:hypothetical protein
MTDAPGSVNAVLFSNKTSINSGTVTPEVLSPAAEALSRRYPERANGGQFTLGQNYPNPHSGETTVPFALANPADVRLDINDMMGRKVAGVVRKGRNPGPQSIKLNLTGLGLPPGDYVYELQVSTKHGLYRQAKLMTTE